MNTLHITQKLEAAGLERSQAEAISDAIDISVREGRGELATRDDIHALRGEMHVLRGEIYRALWIQGAALIGVQLAIAGVIVQLLK